MLNEIIQVVTKIAVYAMLLAFIGFIGYKVYLEMTLSIKKEKKEHDKQVLAIEKK